MKDISKKNTRPFSVEIYFFIKLNLHIEISSPVNRSHNLSRLFSRQPTPSPRTYSSPTTEAFTGPVLHPLIY